MPSIGIHRLVTEWNNNRQSQSIVYLYFRKRFFCQIFKNITMATVAENNGDATVEPIAELETESAPPVDNEVIDESKKSASAPPRAYQLPLSKVKTMAKLDGDTRMMSQECVYLLTLATENFVRMLTRDAHSSMKQCGSKRLDRLHLFSVINTNPSYEFLDGAFD